MRAALTLGRHDGQQVDVALVRSRAVQRQRAEQRRSCLFKQHRGLVEPETAAAEVSRGLRRPDPGPPGCTLQLAAKVIVDTTGERVLLARDDTSLTKAAIAPRQSSARRLRVKSKAIDRSPLSGPLPADAWSCGQAIDSLALADQHAQLEESRGCPLQSGRQFIYRLARQIPVGTLSMMTASLRQASARQMSRCRWSTGMAAPLKYSSASPPRDQKPGMS